MKKGVSVIAQITGDFKGFKLQNMTVLVHFFCLFTKY